jgi:Ger(x)C family germination protein
MKRMKPSKILLFIFAASALIIALLTFIISGTDSEPAEQLDVQVAAGYDFIQLVDGVIQYQLSRCMYVFEENGRTSRTILGFGKTIGMTRDDRQLKADKERLNGLEKMYIVGDAFSRYGIRDCIDSIFKNPLVNDTGIFVVCKGKAMDILNYKIPGYAASADFIEGQIKSQKDLNFISEEYNAKNIYVRLDSEGRTVLIPYIELKKEDIIISGIAIFNKDKMVYVLGMPDARIMNLLLYNDVKGILTLQASSAKYTSYLASAKHKVVCYKENNKYKYIINLELKGDIISNELYDNLNTSMEVAKKFEEDMEDYVKNECDKFINKMKTEIKVDCLELGRIAAATYGRRSGTDWNKEITDSEIKVNVKVKIDNQGRGDY